LNGLTRSKLAARGTPGGILLSSLTKHVPTGDIRCTRTWDSGRHSGLCAGSSNNLLHRSYLPPLADVKEKSSTSRQQGSEPTGDAGEANHSAPKPVISLQ
jgi:hypothetical protein